MIVLRTGGRYPVGSAVLGVCVDKGVDGNCGTESQVEVIGIEYHLLLCNTWLHALRLNTASGDGIAV